MSLAEMRKAGEAKSCSKEKKKKQCSIIVKLGWSYPLDMQENTSNKQLHRQTGSSEERSELRI